MFHQIPPSPEPGRAREPGVAPSFSSAQTRGPPTDGGKASEATAISGRQVKGVYYGMLEFQVRDDAEIAVRELDHRRVQGSSLRLRAYHGDGPGAMG
ncbi:unnamed protein product [Durusdinium trenchii]|uniref:RRM domain-containing protein n=1 Tax=Durusdinium trenchii TaxID=1381693 RepID=A0ABP0PBR7_9DINO